MKYLFILCFLIGFIPSIKQANNSFDIDEEIKVKLFTSILEDGGVYCGGSDTFEENQACYRDVYDNLAINQSQVLKSEFNSKLNISYSYSIQVFKLDAYLGMDIRYILHYKDMRSESWHRIKGYKENDFIHLYRDILLKYCKTKQVQQIINDWQQEMDLLKDIDFDCLLKGIKTKNTKQGCYLATTYQSRNTMYINTSNPNAKIYENEYADFSRRPYSGSLPKVENKKAMRRQFRALMKEDK